MNGLTYLCCGEGRMLLRGRGRGSYKLTLIPIQVPVQQNPFPMHTTLRDHATLIACRGGAWRGVAWRGIKREIKTSTCLIAIDRCQWIGCEESHGNSIASELCPTLRSRSERERGARSTAHRSSTYSFIFSSILPFQVAAQARMPRQSWAPGVGPLQSDG
jgi:hypothetical protein